MKNRDGLARALASLLAHRSALSASGALLMVGLLTVTTVGNAPAVRGDDTVAAAAGPTIARYAGASRFDTAAAISAKTFAPGVEVAYIAYAFNFPDALAGAAAAGTVKGPVLLVSQSGAINSATTTELARLKPARIIVLGGPGVVSDSVKAALVQFATSGIVDRYAGASRFDTAAIISAKTFAPGADVAYIANAFNFPDALAGAAAAGTVKGPVLLVAPDSIDSATMAELARLQPGRIIVLGGTSVVSDAVKNALTSYSTSGTVDRYAGASRFDTAAVISANTFAPGVEVAYLAYAHNFPDALAGAAAAGTIPGPVLLVSQSGAVNAATKAELARLQPQRIIALGGTSVVSDAVLYTAAGLTPPIPPLPACSYKDLSGSRTSYSQYATTLLDTIYKVSSAYLPSDLVSTGLSGGGLVRRIVSADLKAMVAAARAAGARLANVSAYRSYATQVSTFAYWVRVGGMANALATSARAGHSEHQLGRLSISAPTVEGPPSTATGRRPRPARGCRQTPGRTAG